MSDASRAAFEAWAITILGNNPAWRESDQRVSRQELAWQSWQASRKQAREDAANLVDHICKEGGGTYGDAIKELIK